jgi:hypothetical protein
MTHEIATITVYFLAVDPDEECRYVYSYLNLGDDTGLGDAEYVAIARRYPPVDGVTEIAEVGRSYDRRA